jgi:ribosomal protein L7/L12
MTVISDLSQHDATDLQKNLIKIRDLADSLASQGIAVSHEIYKLSRDSLEILTWDQISRDTFTKLLGNREFQGVDISDTVDSYIKNNQIIMAIRELRRDCDLTLKQAKDLVEAYRDSLN